MRRPMTLGQVIRDGRRAKGWTQEMLALKIEEGMTQSDVSRLERDKITLPRRDRLERIARALDIPLGELLAHSGWAAADQFFDRPSPENREAPEKPASHPGGVHPLGQSHSTATRLHEALAQSRALRERTDQLLRQSRNAVRDWERASQQQRSKMNPEAVSDDC